MLCAVNSPWHIPAKHLHARVPHMPIRIVFAFQAAGCILQQSVACCSLPVASRYVLAMLMSLLICLGQSVGQLRHAACQLHFGAAKLPVCVTSACRLLSSCSISCRACSTGRMDSARFLVERGKARLGLKDAQGSTALHVAVACNQQPLALLLASLGADIEVCLLLNT